MSDSLPKSLRQRARHARRMLGAGVRFGTQRLVRRSDDDADAFGAVLAGELDSLKGMAMKVGQILSYMDGIVPDSTQAQLSMLQTGAAPHPWPEMAGCIEGALGSPVDDLFDSVDPIAVAAASIGQVHRGVLGGQDVAIKVQYPGIQESFESDFRQLHRLAGLAGLGTRVDGRAIVDDLRERLIEECDYEHEARWQAYFRERFADDPRVVIPEVFGDRSCKTVLTSEWCEGLTLAQRLISGGREPRQMAAKTLATVAWTSLFSLGVINADPHPGNQLFRDNSVVFLDFGCVREFDASWVAGLRAELLAVLDGDRAAFREALLVSGQVLNEKRFDYDAHWAMQRHFWQPYLTPTYRFEPDWLKAGAHYTQPGNANLRRLNITPEWVWLARLQWGLHSLLVRLGAEGDFRDVLRGVLEPSATE